LSIGGRARETSSARSPQCARSSLPPTRLRNDTIRLLAYPVESAIAEKLQAMVALGNANSRMKDF
jgi:hypothetical protein